MARRDDLLSAAAWGLLGAVIVVASWRMDRLPNLGINPWSVPGLTPGVVGALIVVLAAALAWQSRKRTAPAADAETPEPTSTRRSALAAALCVTFAGLTLGRGTPFVVEGTVFVAVFIILFSWSTWREEGRVARGLAQAVVVAVAACVSISWLFESVFLVRLP